MTIEADDAQTNTDATDDNTSTDDTGTILGGADEANTDTDSDASDDATDKDDAGDATDDKDDDDTDDDDSDADKDKDTDEDEPELFDVSKLELPEGFELDQAMLDEFAPLAEKLKLNQEDGGELAKLYTEGIQRVFDNMVQQQTETVQNWAKDAQNDADMGGANWKDTSASAQKAIETFGSPELKKVLNETGIGNHPEMIRLMSKIGKAVAEDSFDTGNPATKQKDDLSAIYDHPTSQQKN